MKLNLTKPLVFFDLETTGVQVGSDHIVEICLLKVAVDGRVSTYVQRVNPGMPIPPQSTEIHGITDEMVCDKPTFKELSAEIANFIGDSDLAGYNSNKFDIPLLVEEFLRVGINFDISNRKTIDVQNIFHKMEPRTLKAAYKFYCGKNLDNAHSAEADTMATYEILMAQIERYNGVEYEDRDGNISYPIVNDMRKLQEFTNASLWADLVGHLGFNKEGKEVFNFGKYKGKAVEDVFEIEPAYYDWMMKADFPLSTKRVITDIRLRSKFVKGAQTKLF
ncbi:MAG: 3'-5' exonuclease [Bacteroidales bacterium]|nr:3'-5' exonuclease [Bacteroidales bacterium]